MSGILQILRIGSTSLLALAALGGCQNLAQVENRGYVTTRPVEEQIVVGKTNRGDVRNLLGSPSTMSSYPPETWYYISRERETVGFLSPELTEQKVARIEFDEAGRVSSFDRFGTDAAREMDFVKRETPTEGRSLGLFEQLLGNLGRFNTPRDATQSRQ